MVLQVSEREKSFDRVVWPPHLDAQPDNLAAAGLYYVGPGDRVKCAFCGGKLKNWQPQDLPIEEHCNYFPDCPFVQSNENQPSILCKSIHRKKELDKYVSSDELMKQYEEQRLWRKTLKKMGYCKSIVKKAEERCMRSEINVCLESILTEIQLIEKENFFGTGDHATEELDEGVESGEGQEDVTPSEETMDVDELVRKLEQECKWMFFLSSC